MGQVGKQERSELENGQIVLVDPGVLVEQNAAVSVVNWARYNRFKTEFSRPLWYPVYLVRVLVSTKDGDRVEDRIEDGFTRAHFANDFKGRNVNDSGPHFFDKIPTVDATNAVLKGRGIQGRNYLAMGEYLESVIDYTLVHDEIAAQRIAVHLLTGWRDLVGPDLSQKFSALAALNFLYDKNTPLIHPEAQIVKFLELQKEIIGGESKEERRKLNLALRDVANVIRKTVKIKDQIINSAFSLVAQESDQIGGFSEAAKQIQGLLNTSEVDRMLSGAFPNDRKQGDRLASAAQVKSELATLMLNYFRKFGAGKDGERLVSNLGLLLADERLDLAAFKRILSAKDPQKIYDDIRKEINVKRLIETYRQRHNSNLSKSEIKLLDSLGQRLNLPDVYATSKAISEASKTVQQLSVFRDELARGKSSYLSSGVTKAAFEEIDRRLKEAEENLLNSDTEVALNTRAKEITKLIAESRSKINEDIKYQKIYNLVSGRDQLAGSTTEVVAYLRKVDSSLTNESAIKETLTALSSLDSKMLDKVLKGDITLVAAKSQPGEGATRSSVVASEKNSGLSEPKPQIAEVPTQVTQRVKVTESKQGEVAHPEIQAIVDRFMVDFNKLSLTPNEISPQDREELLTLTDFLVAKLTGLPDIRQLVIGYRSFTRQRAKRLEDQVEKGNQESSDRTL